MGKTLAAKPWDGKHDLDEGFVLRDAAARAVALVTEE